MTKSPRPNVTRNLSHARGPARRVKARARPEPERASGSGRACDL